MPYRSAVTIVGRAPGSCQTRGGESRGITTAPSACNHFSHLLQSSQHATEALQELSEERIREKDAIRGKLDMLRKVMSAKAESEGTNASLHIENVRLNQQVRVCAAVFGRREAVMAQTLKS